MSKSVTAQVMASVIGKIDAARAEAWAKADLSVMQLRVLRYIDANPGASNMAIARGLRVAQPSVSALVDRLEQRRLVKRGISKRDRRGIEVMLTKKGSGLLTGSGAELKAVADLFMPLSDAEVERLEELLAKVLR